MSREQALREAAWVAEFLNVSEAWVHEATKAGTLPCVRLGDAVRFHPDAIKAWARGKPSSSDALKTKEGEFLTVEEAAALLRLNRKTVLEALARKKLPGKRIGRLWRVSRAGLLEWLGASARPDGQGKQ